MFFKAKKKGESAAAAHRHESVALVSHRLLTPLGRIRYAAEALLGETASLPLEEKERAQALVRRIMQDAASLVHGVIIVLEYSDLFEHEKIRFGATDAAQVVAQVIAQFEPLMKEKGISFTASVPNEKMPRVSMNELYLQTLLEVLLANAVKYVPYGGQIRLSVAHITSQLVFTVADNGSGMSKEKIASLFADSLGKTPTAAPQDGGTGLGLVVSKHIIERHGGEIRADSPGEGRGSVFSFNVPAIS